MKWKEQIKSSYEKGWLGILVSCLWGAAIVFSGMLYNIAYDAIVLEWGVYTVGTRQNIYYDKGGKYMVETVYFYQDKEYVIRGRSYFLRKKDEGSKVVIKFLPNYPTLKRILDYYEVPPEVEPPPQGWEDLPPEIRKTGEHRWFPKFINTKDIARKPRKE